MATSARGRWMGNRGGVIHDDTGRIVRAQASRAWITCRLSFRDRHRTVMTPRRYTELFFLDEATALAAGHRPCFECRRRDAGRFMARYADTGDVADPRVADLDARLSRERRVARTAMGAGKRTCRMAAATLPTGTMIRIDGTAHLVVDDTIRRWSFEGHGSPHAVPPGEVEVLTPPATVAILAAGYVPDLHPTARH